MEMPEVDVFSESVTIGQKRIDEQDLETAVQMLNTWGFDARRTGVGDIKLVIGRDPEQKIDIRTPSISKIVTRENELFIDVTEPVNGATKVVTFSFTSDLKVLITNNSWEVTLQGPL